MAIDGRRLSGIIVKSQLSLSKDRCATFMAGYCPFYIKLLKKEIQLCLIAIKDNDCDFDRDATKYQRVFDSTLSMKHYTSIFLD